MVVWASKDCHSTKPSPYLHKESGSGPPSEAAQPVPPHTMCRFPFLSLQLAESSFPFPTPCLEELRAVFVVRIVERRQMLWDLPGTSGPQQPPRINIYLVSDGSTSCPKVPLLLKKAEPISLPCPCECALSLDLLSSVMMIRKLMRSRLSTSSNVPSPH